MTGLRQFLGASVLSGIIGALIFACLLTACSSTSKLSRNQATVDTAVDTSAALKSGFTGLYVADLNTGEVLLSRNADKYFTPASTVKILTLFACLKTLKDSLTAFKYVETDSSLTLWGAADPTFLHPFFDSDHTADFLREKASQKSVFISYGHSGQLPYGEGWMWDDYSDYYQAEMTSFPAFGNVLLLKKEGTDLTTMPSYLSRYFKTKTEVRRVRRAKDKNEFVIPAGLDTLAGFYQEVPYLNAEQTNAVLTGNILAAEINDTMLPISREARSFYSVPLDTVLRRMMAVSDNMLAEHLLLQAGFVAGDTISSEWTLDHLEKDTVFAPVRPYWVDGSGLSRYNRLTPAALGKILRDMYGKIPEKRLFSLFPAGGSEGTVKSLFADQPSPYVFAKSGSMSGVYNLGGYMMSKSGRKLVFCIMNNQFDATVKQARTATELILKKVRTMY